jgi:hypothetical protein
MTTAIAADRYFSPMRILNTAASDAGAAISRYESSLKDHFFEPASRQTSGAIQKLQELRLDEDNIKPNLRTLEQALSFIMSLPSWLPAPDVGVDNDGDITFEWYSGPYKTITVAIDAEGKLNYAVLFSQGINRHGTDFFADGIPKDILQAIIRILPPSPTAVASAA